MVPESRFNIVTHVPAHVSQTQCTCVSRVQAMRGNDGKVFVELRAARELRSAYRPNRRSRTAGSCHQDQDQGRLECREGKIGGRRCYA